MKKKNVGSNSSNQIVLNDKSEKKVNLLTRILGDKLEPLLYCCYLKYVSDNSSYCIEKLLNYDYSHFENLENLINYYGLLDFEYYCIFIKNLLKGDIKSC